MSVRRHDAKSYRARQERTGEPLPWLVRITYGRGRRWRHTIDGRLTQAQARDLERTYLVRLEKGLDPLAAGPADLGRSPLTWGGLRERYWQRAGRHLKSADRLQDHLERITLALGAGTPAAGITTAAVSAAVARWREEVVVLLYKKGGRKVLGPNGPTTINTRLRILRRALSWAVEHLGDDCPPLPAVAWKALRLEEPDRDPRASYQPPGIRDSVAAAAAPHVRHALRIAEATGRRQAEVLALRWENVDRAAGTYRVAVKSRKPGGKWQTYPIPAGMAAVLDEIGWRDVGPVVAWGGRPVASVKKGVRLARERAGAAASGFTMKALRHTAAMDILGSGGSIEEASKALGHSDTAVTRKHYSGELGIERVRAALERREAARKPGQKDGTDG
jgi:integrase